MVLLLLMIVGESIPVMVGNGAAVIVPLTASGMATREERHAPSVGTTDVELAHCAGTQDPRWRALLASEQARHDCGPEPVQLEQVLSHVWHAPLVVSKNWFLLHVLRHLPPCRTGLDAGHEAH